MFLVVLQVDFSVGFHLLASIFANIFQVQTSTPKTVVPNKFTAINDLPSCVGKLQTAEQDLQNNFCTRN
jgi:hypothetical protein